MDTSARLPFGAALATNQINTKLKNHPFLSNRDRIFRILYQQCHRSRAQTHFGRRACHWARAITASHVRSLGFRFRKGGRAHLRAAATTYLKAPYLAETARGMRIFSCALKEPLAFTVIISGVILSHGGLSKRRSPSKVRARMMQRLYARNAREERRWLRERRALETLFAEQVSVCTRNGQPW
jgi:hypothetical protein